MYPREVQTLHSGIFKTLHFHESLRFFVTIARDSHGSMLQQRSHTLEAPMVYVLDKWIMMHKYWAVQMAKSGRVTLLLTAVYAVHYFAHSRSTTIQ